MRSCRAGKRCTLSLRELSDQQKATKDWLRGLRPPKDPQNRTAGLSYVGLVTAGASGPTAGTRYSAAHKKSLFVIQ